MCVCACVRVCLGAMAEERPVVLSLCPRHVSCAVPRACVWHGDGWPGDSVPGSGLGCEWAGNESALVVSVHVWQRRREISSYRSQARACCPGEILLILRVFASGISSLRCGCYVAGNRAEWSCLCPGVRLKLLSAIQMDIGRRSKSRRYEFGKSVRVRVSYSLVFRVLFHTGVDRSLVRSSSTSAGVPAPGSSSRPALL